MLSLTSEYALRAMIHLACHEDEWPIPGREIAKQADIPAKYLSKVLGDLVRAGVLEATRGLGGGFRLARTPKRTALYDVLAPFESFDLRRCPFGNKRCDDENPCLAHDRWKKVVEAQQRFLRTTSVHAIAVGATSKNKPSARRR